MAEPHPCGGSALEYRTMLFEVWALWFPVNPNLRYVITVFNVESKKPLKGKATVELEFQSGDKKPFRDTFENDLGGKNDVYILYENATGWEEVSLSGVVRLKKEELTFRKTLPGYGSLKTSSLILAHSISKNDRSALFKRGDIFIRPCFNCVFYGYLNFYLEVLCDSSYVITGLITRAGKPVLRLPTKTYTSSQNLSMSIPIWKLEEGKYRITLSVISPSLGEEVKLEREFIVSKYGDNIASFIDYVASEEEKREFRELVGVEAKINFLKRFWEKRGEGFYEEFRRRVMHADSAFSTPNRLGRYTDMGRIYIKRGQPDEVARVDVGEGRKPYIRWTYYTGGGYSYYFYDPIGTGEYVLVRTDDPSEATYDYRSRQPSLDINEGSGWDW